MSTEIEAGETAKYDKKIEKVERFSKRAGKYDYGAGDAALKHGAKAAYCGSASADVLAEKKGDHCPPLPLGEAMVVTKPMAEATMTPRTRGG